LEVGPFVVYQRLDKCPPAVGLTTIVGDNGTGKSSWYEALAWCLHGDTVRGAKVKDARVEVQVEVRGEVYTIERERNARKHKLRLACGALDLSGATPTETQRKIDATVGTHERFCAGRVFARDLLARFGLATDKERKALLEEVLGFQQFDRALVGCRTEAAQEDVKRGLADRDLVNAKRSDQEALERVREIKARRVPPLAEAQAALGAAQEERRKLAEEHQAAERAWRAARERSLKAREDAHRSIAGEMSAQAIRASIVAAETGCPTCGQPWPDVAAEVSRLQAKLQESLQEADGLAKLRVAVGLAEEEEAELMAAARRVGLKVAAAHDRAVELSGELELATRHAEDYADAVAHQTETEAEMRAAEAAREKHAHAHAVLKVADQVLGLKGARVLLLTRAFKRLEQEANLVLARLHPTLRVTVETNEQGGVELGTGQHGGGEYRGCSGGQRVLIDVALMLGLAALQGGDGLVVFDEVFDSLDGRAVDAVAEYLQEVARDRQVVVISHREDLVLGFRAAASWKARVEGDFSVMEDA